MSKEAHAASRRTSSKPRQVLVFPMKDCGLLGGTVGNAIWAIGGACVSSI